MKILYSIPGDILYLVQANNKANNNWFFNRNHNIYIVAVAVNCGDVEQLIRNIALFTKHPKYKYHFHK